MSNFALLKSPMKPIPCIQSCNRAMRMRLKARWSFRLPTWVIQLSTSTFSSLRASLSPSAKVAAQALWWISWSLSHLRVNSPLLTLWSIRCKRKQRRERINQPKSHRVTKLYLLRRRALQPSNLKSLRKRMKIWLRRKILRRNWWKLNSKKSKRMAKSKRS